MEKNRLIKWLFLVFSFIALLIFIIVFYITFTFSKCKIQAENESDAADTCLYHVIVTGTYGNLEFLQKVYKGASQKAESYNALVDLSLPYHRNFNRCLPRSLHCIHPHSALHHNPCRYAFVARCCNNCS